MKDLCCRKTVWFLLVQCCSSWLLHAQPLDSLVQRSLEFSRSQLLRTVTELHNSSVYGDSVFPRSTNPLTGVWIPKLEGHWASGFLPGCLWYMFDWTSDSIWRNSASEWTTRLAHEQCRTKDHEAGFIVPPSFGNGYRLTNDTVYRNVLLQAAHSLASRYNATVGCLKSWESYHYPVIIDGMNALQLLWWASKEEGDTSLYQMAMSHSLRTMENNVRPDGSAYQIVDYDSTSGSILSRTNKQGYSSTSTWSRGQAWAVYGFTVAYRETRDERFSQTAQKVADYFVDNLPADKVPYWDFQAPNIPQEEKDASAAAIAASGLLELSSLLSAGTAAEKYRNAALAILTSLCSPGYLAEGTDSRGILLHGVGNRMNPDLESGEVDVSLIYSDYYFIEALVRYTKAPSSVVVLRGGFEARPSSVFLYQNYPNPFNAGTEIRYALPKACHVVLRIYSLLGQLVATLKDENETAGSKSVRWYARDRLGNEASSGLYFCVLQSDNSTTARRMVLLR